MSTEQVERIKKEHEDAAIKEILHAVPHVNVLEIRRLLKEHGDTNKVVELLTGEEPKENIEQKPNQADELPLPKGSTQDESETCRDSLQLEDPEELETDDLRMSIEVLSLETKSTQPEVGELSSAMKEQTPSPPPSSQSIRPDDQKSRARQRRQVSSARKEKQAKRMQKEAAKRRKRMEARGLGKEDEEDEDKKHELKAIII